MDGYGDPMPDEEFHRVEGILDGLVKKDEERLRSAGLHVEDHSARRYYKNDPLSWCYQSKREWIVDGETARVTVSLCYQQSVSEYYGQAPPEQEPPVIAPTWDAEQFQHGQVSRMRQTCNVLWSLRDLQREGISAVVTKAIVDGAACLPAASQSDAQTNASRR